MERRWYPPEEPPAPLKSIFLDQHSIGEAFHPHRNCHSNCIYGYHISASICTTFCLLKVLTTSWIIVATVRVLSTQSFGSGHFSGTDFPEHLPTQLYIPIMISRKPLEIYKDGRKGTRMESVRHIGGMADT